MLAPEPLTRYAVAKAVEQRYGGDDGILRTKRQHAYDLVPALEANGLIRVVGTAPTRTSREPTSLFGATQAGVHDWRAWLSSPIAMPDAMTGALARLYAVRQGDFATMLGIIDRYEAMLRLMVQRAEDPVAPDHIVERIRSVWSRRELVAQLQWCQHSREIVTDAMAGTSPWR
ncbi:DNA-binding PadR family transcriptional regulator [Conexibacter arvalis]|uniref:DNA-binding PadR family transcriptional regulator n=1 Tax=Conexibacter arvalis TaxID=912552 RepID=A0A840IIU6_9ACTN|nr:DNA-binding PadR family transcriptional regulator [Conexibacter arvalis]